MIIRYCIYHGKIVLAEHGEKVMRFPIPGRHIKFVEGEDSYTPIPVRFAERTIRMLSVDCNNFYFASDLPLYARNLIRKREKMDLREEIHGTEKAVRDALAEYFKAVDALTSFERNPTNRRMRKIELPELYTKKNGALTNLLVSQQMLWRILYSNGFITEDEIDRRLNASIEERIEMAMRMAERRGGRV